MVAVASFTDANPNGSVGDFSATIDWATARPAPASSSPL